MAEAVDNLTKQVEEVEALSAIYGDWRVLDEAARKYHIQITDGLENRNKSISLQIQMPLNYPNDAPPVYELSAPWLRGEERKELDTSLQDICCDNMGESIIHLWICQVQEFLQHLSPDSDEEALTVEVVSPVEVREYRVAKQGHIGDYMWGTSQPRREKRQFYCTESVPEWSSITDCPYSGYLYISAHPCPEIRHGEPLSDRKSKFQAHIAHVTHISQVQMVMDELRSDARVDAATHNITAYRICKDEKKSLFEEDSVDDGEIHAGSRLQHLLQKMDARNVMIIVTRWYGGIHLGPDRFRHINSLAKNLLEEYGYSRDKSEKKGPKSGGKKGR